MASETSGPFYAAKATYAALPEKNPVLQSDTDEKTGHVFRDCLRNCCIAIWNPCCANNTRKTYWLTTALLLGAGGIGLAVGGEIGEGIAWPLLVIGSIAFVLGACAYIKECRDGY